MFGLGGTQGSPVSPKNDSRRHPDIATVRSRTGRSARNSPLKSRASSAAVIPCASAIGSRPTKLAYGRSSTGPAVRRPPTGFGRSSTTTALSASAAARMQS